MLKHKSIVLASYVSPAVKWVELSTRKSIMYTSPTTRNLDFDNDPGSVHETGDVTDYGDL